MRHPEVPEELRGTYVGLALGAGDRVLHHRSASRAVELLPVHQFVDDRHLLDRGLQQLLGLQHDRLLRARRPLLAPTGEPVSEFKTMVEAAPRRGHRGDPRRGLQPHRRGQPPRPDDQLPGHRQPGLLPPQPGGPALLRRLHRHRQHAQRAPPARCCSSSWTRCATGSPRCTSTASASTSRPRWRASCTTSTSSASFFDIIHQDPIISQVKLIAEPWDVGPGGYQVGNFPVRWAEWNGKYRDSVRRFWKGDRRPGRRARLPPERVERPLRQLRPAAVRERSTSSPRTTASRCTTSSRYNDKHNEANGEDNRDGDNDNESMELRRRGRDRRRGDRARLRERQMRNLLATLLLCQGVPMLCGGDEIGRTPGRQQQRLLPGQRDQLVRLGPRPARPAAARLHTRASSGSSSSTPSCVAAASSRGGRSAARGSRT